MEKIKHTFNNLKKVLLILLLISLATSYILYKNEIKLAYDISIALSTTLSISIALTFSFQMTLTKIINMHTEETNLKIENSFNRYIDKQNNYYNRVYNQIINVIQNPNSFDSFNLDFKKIIRYGYSIKNSLYNVKVMLEETLSNFSKPFKAPDGTLSLPPNHEESIIGNINSVINLIQEIELLFVPYEIKNRYNTDGIPDLAIKIQVQNLVKSLCVDKDNFEKLLEKYYINKHRFFLRIANIYDLSNVIEPALTSLISNLEKVPNIN